MEQGYLPRGNASCFAQHGLQALQQQAEHKHRLASHHLLTKVGDVLGVQLARLPANKACTSPHTDCKAEGALQPAWTTCNNCLQAVMLGMSG